MPRDRLARVCFVCKAFLAGPEFFGPAWAATSGCHRRKIDTRQTRRYGQGIQADSVAADCKPMRKVSVTGRSGTEPAHQRRQTKSVELRNAQQLRSQELIGGRVRDKGQSGMSRKSRIHANLRALITDCSNSGVMHSFFERIAASAVRDNSSLTCPVMPAVALMIARTMARLAEIRDACRSGNCHSNPARKLRKSSFSCHRGSSKLGKRLAIWESVCIAASVSRVPSTTIAHLGWLDRNLSRFSDERCSCAVPASRWCKSRWCSISCSSSMRR